MARDPLKIARTDALRASMFISAWAILLAMQTGDLVALEKHRAAWLEAHDQAQDQNALDI